MLCLKIFLKKSILDLTYKANGCNFLKLKFFLGAALFENLFKNVDFRPMHSNEAKTVAIFPN